MRGIVRYLRVFKRTKPFVFVTYAQAIEVMKFKDEIYRLCKKEDADALFDGLTEDSNPVLLFYRVKI